MTAANTALITGASSGIGAAYADRLAKRGHDLILVARDRARMAALAAKIGAETARSVEILPADLANRADLARVAHRLRTDPAIGMLVNNAGVAAVRPMRGADPDEMAAMVNLNVTAALRLAQAAVDAFAERNHGTLINIASVVALAPGRLNATYGASKAFLLSLSQGLALELADTKVRVQAVLPGATLTDIWTKAGIDVANVMRDRVMGVDDMVDAALAGLDMGETVTIPSLPDVADWHRFETARKAMEPNLSLARPAARYNRKEAVL